MRASSWLYQYSSQSKFTYGVCPPIPPAGHSPVSSMAYAGPAESIGEYNHHARPPSAPYIHEMTPYQNNLDDGSGWNKDQSRGVPSHVKQEPQAAAQPGYGEPRARGLEDAEPVDMSINSTCPAEHDERHNAEFCPCNKAHLPMVSQLFIIRLRIFLLKIDTR